MRVKYIHVDTSSGRQSVYDPAWEEVESLIKSLDGEVRDCVTLCPAEESDDDEEMFVIRAGAPGMYLCEYFDGDNYCLMNPQPSLLAGDRSDLPFNPPECITDLESVLIAARAYLEEGVRSPRFIWKKD